MCDVGYTSHAGYRVQGIDPLGNFRIRSQGFFSLLAVGSVSSASFDWARRDFLSFQNFHENFRELRHICFTENIHDRWHIGR